jgi:hypothetical protein
LATSDNIDEKRLAEEARASEHGEAYRAMEKIDEYRIGIGARVNGGLVYFVEVVVPVTSGPRVELGEMERSLDVLKRLDEEGFTLTPQEDGSISGELLVPEDELERGYERVVSILKSLSDTVSLPGNSAY